MKRRTLLQWFASIAAVLPFERVRLLAQPRELTRDAIDFLHELAPTVLPASIGSARINATVDQFVAWTRGYREGVALSHGYGHPRLQKTAASPVPLYLSQLTALEADARSKGAPWSALDLETRRALLDASIAKASVRGLPQRPSGQHVVVDLMATYFRSSEANDDCYRAMIGRETCRPIAVTIRKPEPLRRP
ncbi:MAG TPA: hypothetical protein VGY57_13255 [Vicinamibacterales bacterium]|nr:hypothetical protein [Vicinamibacterales bacterium]